MKSICYITGGSNTFGFGHICRSMDLLKQLTSDYKVSFFVYCPDDINGSFGITRMNYIEKPYQETVSDLIVIDLPKSFAEKSVYYYKTRMKEVPLMALGYYSHMNRTPDIVINLNDSSGFNEGHFPKSYLGLDYSIVREGYFKLRSMKRKFTAQTTYLFYI